MRKRGGEEQMKLAEIVAYLRGKQMKSILKVK